MDDGRLLAERLLTAPGRKHAQMLTAETALLFRHTGRTPADCSGVAVSIGPGSFTGLRIGVVAAKTFAYAVGCRIAAVDTLQAIAEECPRDGPRLWVISDAQRGDLYVGEFHQPSGTWRRDCPIAIQPARSWCSSRTVDDVVTGPGTARWQDELAGRCQVLPEHFAPRAATICRLGQRQIEAGGDADAWAIEPYYIRKSSAEEQWERRHGTR